MAREVLDHGVIIPAEFSDDWYEDMSTNLNKLDAVIGSDAEKLSEEDVSAVATSGDYDDLTNKPDLKPVATSGDYDDLTNKPSYGVLRMTSETLSNSGSGAISNLNSDSKLAAGDYVLDAALKVFPITAVSAPNYTVGTSLFQVTNASALAAVATSGSYDDLNNLPAYGITRFVNAAITDNSNVAFANISSVDKIKAGDFLLDNAGKMYLIASVDTVNETAAVTTPLTQLAVDANVMHLSGDETAPGKKTFADLTTFNSWLYFTNSSVTKGIIPQSTVTPYRIYFGSGVNYGASLFNIDTSVSNLGVQTLTFRAAENVVSGDDARLMLIYDPNRSQPKYLSLKGDLEPNANNTYECGSSSNRLKDLYVYHGYFCGQQKGDEFSGNARTDLTLLGNRDTLGQSGVCISKFRQNRPQGSMSGTDVVQVTFDVLENSVRSNRLWYLNWLDWENDVPKTVEVRSCCEKVDYKLTHINALNPGALSFPDLSAGLDISAYITDLTGASNINKYTPTVDGWISVGLSNADFIELYIPSSLIGGTFTKSTINNYSQAFMPVIANKEVRIALKGSSIGWAKFYPNLGNV